MNPNLDILKRVEAAIEFEKKRHRLNLNILTKVAEMMKSMTEDTGGLSDVAVEVLAGHVGAKAAEAAGVPHPTLRKPATSAKASSRRGIVNMDEAGRKGSNRSGGLTAAIREAITYFGSESFKTGEILAHVRQHHPQLEVDTGTISKRLYQLRNAGFIELVPGGKVGKHGAHLYRLKST